MPTEHDHDIRQLAEAVCGKCGGSLGYYSDEPKPDEEVFCHNVTCGNRATYGKVATDCSAWYDEYMDFYNHQAALGSMPDRALKRWKPRGKYQFVLKTFRLAEMLISQRAEPSGSITDWLSRDQVHRPCGTLANGNRGTA